MGGPLGKTDVVLLLPEQTTPGQGGEFYLGDFEDFIIGGDSPLPRVKGPN
jgi:hypothetical protein